MPAAQASRPQRGLVAGRWVLGGALGDVAGHTQLPDVAEQLESFPGGHVMAVALGEVVVLPLGDPAELRGHHARDPLGAHGPVLGGHAAPALWVARLRYGGQWIAAERELDGDGSVLEERLHGRRGQQHGMRD